MAGQIDSAVRNFLTGQTDVVRNFLLFCVEEFLIKDFIQILHQRLEEQGQLVDLSAAIRRYDFESGHNPLLREICVNYGDVLLENWSPRLYRRIQALVQEEWAPLALYAALQWRLEPITLRRIQALSNLVEFTTNPDQLSDYLTEMLEQLPLIHAELTIEDDL